MTTVTRRVRAGLITASTAALAAAALVTLPATASAASATALSAGPAQVATTSVILPTLKHANARLTSGGAGVGGQTITFTTAGTHEFICSAATNASGDASCDGGLSIVMMLNVLSQGYTATYGGSASYAGATAHGTAGLI